MIGFNFFISFLGMVIINGVFSYVILEVSEVCYVINIFIRCEDCLRKVLFIVEL